MRAAELVSVLKDRTESERTRGEAAYLLSVPEVFEELSAAERRGAVRAALQGFSEDKSHLAWGAAHVLHTAKEKKAWKALSAVATGHLSSKTRFNAVYALGMLGDRRAVPALAHILKNRSESASLRGLAAEALGACGPRSRQAISALLRALGDESPEVRLFSANALALCGGKPAIPALKTLLKDRAVVRPYGSVAKEASKAISTVRGRLSGSSGSRR